MHDGSLPTLEAVVDHCAGRNVVRKPVMPAITPTPTARAALVAFLSTLDTDQER